MARAKNPVGKRSEKPWRDALAVAVNRYYDDPDTSEKGRAAQKRGLALIASRLVKLAIAGDVAAIKEIGDRMDGRVTQTIEGKGDFAGGTGPAITVMIVDHLTDEKGVIIEHKADPPVAIPANEGDD